MLRLRGIVLLLAVALAAPVFGAVSVWFGGESGSVNLPACAQRGGNGPRTVPTNFRYGYKMRAAKLGFELVLPGNMPMALATFSYNGTTLPTQVVEGKIQFPGSELTAMRRSGVDSFMLTLQGVNGELRVVVVLAENLRHVCHVLIE